ncbi:SDR family oxidoreductase [Xinfangfangia sp. D13-10-4-6]|uniref:SDR family oxidoreductase n=1 Tax=Pseudogemmobacter hezensis TaxID=2737662 RepID=UPI001555F4F9|nr:SDR family oxidoreductase [Pseudogemmobacter hezensis]NPD13790.1 SDR family oxidoreductase [Pseudogemmobacter hezensis]
MDLGIRGKKALVTAASKGLGRGCAAALAEAGVELVICARGEEALRRTATELSEKYQVSVTPVVADITEAAARARVLEQAEGADILVTNAGGPPPGVWTDWSREDFIRALDANMLTPIALMQALVPAMAARGWGRVVNITSASVRAPVDVLGLSNAARNGLTGFVAGTSRQVAGKGVAINNLLPGLHATDRAVALDQGLAARESISVEAAKKQRESGIPAGRYGTTAEFGAACAFLCSAHAGFIIGQNIMLDGGANNLTV